MGLVWVAGESKEVEVFSILDNVSINPAYREGDLNENKPVN